MNARSSTGSARANLSEEVAQLAQCEEIVKEMMEMEDCWPFLSPVSRREVRLCCIYQCISVHISTDYHRLGLLYRTNGNI